MVKKLYLHVGMDKTGTSAIQQFIYNNRKTFLSDSRVCYPKTGLWSDYSHHPYAFSLIQQYGFSNDDMPFLLKKLSKEVDSQDSVLLSSECLFKMPRNNNFDLFWDFICSTFYDVTVIVYVRRQDQWVESRHKHSILSGAEIALEKLCGDWFCNYKRFIDDWAALVGRDKVIVRAYEKEQFRGGNIFEDFLDLFGVGMNENYQRPNNTINASLGGKEALFKSLCNHIGLTERGAAQLNSVLLEYSRIEKSYQGDCLLMTVDEKKLLIEKYSDVNSSIAKEYLGREDGVLFTNVSVACQDVDEVCLGLDDGQVREITSFIRNTSPRIMRMLKRHIENGVKESNSDVAAAAKKLLVGI